MENGALPPIIDSAVIAELDSVGGPKGAKLLQRVLDLFIAHAPPATAQIESLARGNDLKALAEAAHALKSMCASVGAKRALTACHELEKLARDGQAFDAGGKAADIAREMAAALREAEVLRSA